MRWQSIPNIVASAMLISLQACNAQQKLGAATPDRLVDRYLLALETQDRVLMAQLVPPDRTATTEIAAKIERLGGRKLQERRVTYTKIRPTFWSARIEAIYVDRQGNKQKFRDIISTSYQGNESWKLYSGRWYLLLSKDSAAN